MRLALLGMAAMLLAGCAVTPRVAAPAAVLASAPAGLGSVAAGAATRGVTAQPASSIAAMPSSARRMLNSPAAG